MKISSKPTLKTININDEVNINTKNKLSDEGLNKNTTINPYKHLYKRKKKKIKTKVSFSSNLTKLAGSETNNKDMLENNNEQNINQLQISDDKIFYMSNSNDKQINNEKEKDINIDNSKEKRNIVEKIKISKSCICCSFYVQENLIICKMYY